MPVILFDIDGTLVRTGGAGKAAMEAALSEEFGVAISAEEVPYSGRTDRAIGRDLLTAHAIDPSPANQLRLTNGYLTRLPKYLNEHDGTICPGIGHLLEKLQDRDDVLLGLLTGNVRAGARHKLGHYGLWEFFTLGGFGDDHYERDDVARAALTAVEAHRAGPVDPADVWVIGDTPLDVRCARAIGAKAVAVATGWHTLDVLEATHPDFALADLSEPRELLRAWNIGN
ncbi:HAD family hydrolase [Fimbriiglobus ruber]|uniref:Haloacid dehalogenase domain protein hydrolase n=1 Tax=Fimbriiglobus ruber TaxID=1908690 RepID=A0A225E361_9BACT|nr:HAD family hydrolase [Fimbriiglobus ruber]OWK43115.1 Haloacid dehalogenase domain protein hydrolase [Fimbriiglobus ruber]